MPNWNQLQERDPEKMKENLRNAMGLQQPAAPQMPPSDPIEDSVAQMQAANLARAKNDPEFAAKLAAINAMRQKAIDQQMQNLVIPNKPSLP